MGALAEKLVGLFVAIAAGMLVQLVRVYVIDPLRENREQRRAARRLAQDPYTPAALKRVDAMPSSYVRPDCQDNDPAAGGMPINRRPIFAELDLLLGPPPRCRFLLLLGDSGMGKTSCLLRYYRYHWLERTRASENHVNVVLIPLSDSNADKLMSTVPIQLRSNTVLLLDGLDEDPAALRDYNARIGILTNLATEFYAVIVSCRTQFLSVDRWVPSEVGPPPLQGAQALEAGPDRRVLRIFLSPFSNGQVDDYLNARFGRLRHPLRRWRAHAAASRFGDLASRPLLLTYLHLLPTNAGVPKQSFQLYRLIVQEWIEREYGKGRLRTQRGDIKAFLHDLSREIFQRADQQIPQADLDQLAQARSVSIDPADVRERSLLHCDAGGNWKFAHRSIMEFLLVDECSRSSDPEPWRSLQWTDQMRAFACEMIMSGTCAGFPGADLRGVNLRRSKVPVVELGSVNLEDADLTAADLSNARGLSIPRAMRARSDFSTFWPVVSIAAHSDCINDAVIDPEGSVVLSASADKTLRLWDSTTGHLLRTLRGHKDAVNACAISNDRRFIVSASDDKTLLVWDMESGRIVHHLRGHRGRVTECLFTSSGRFVVSASILDYTIRVWDLQSGAAVHVMTGHRNWVGTCILSPTDDRVLSASGDHTVRVWDPAAGTLLRTLEGHRDEVDCCAISPGGDFVVSVARDHTLRIWDAKTGQQMRVQEAHHADWCAVSPDGKLVLATCYPRRARDGEIRIWGVERGDLVHVLKHRGAIHGCAVSSAGDYVLSTSYIGTGFGGTAHVWNLKSGTESLRLRGHKDAAKGPAIDVHGDFAVTLGFDRTIRVWFPS